MLEVEEQEIRMSHDLLLKLYKNLCWCYVFGVFFSWWKQDIPHRTMPFQWGKTVSYLRVIPVMCAQESPQKLFPSLRLVLQQGISEDSWPALKSPRTVRIHTVLHWRHHLPKALWGRGRLITATSWQQSSTWAWRANPTETQPSSPLSRAFRGRHHGVLPPPQGRSLLQRSVGALLQKAMEIFYPYKFLDFVVVIYHPLMSIPRHREQVSLWMFMASAIQLWVI